MSKQEKSRKPLIIGIIAAVVILAVLLVVLLTQCTGGGEEATTSTPVQTTAGSEEAPTYDLYWNVDRAEYDGKSEAGMSSRQPESDGYFYVRFFKDGEMLDLRVADRKTINSIDVNDLMGLEFDEDGIVIGVISLDDMPLEQVGWQFYVQSVGGKLIKLNSAGNMSGMEVLLELTDAAHIYDMTGMEGEIGSEITPVTMDRVLAIANLDGVITHIFVYDRSEYMRTHEAYCEHCEKNETWYEWTKTDKLPTTTGHYQLMNNVDGLTVQQALVEDAKVCLDLNGMAVDGADNRRVYTLHNAGTSLAIMDTSEEQTGVLRGHSTSSDQGGVVWVRYGQFHLYSGTLDASDMISKLNGTAVEIPKNSYFYMHGGRIIGGTAKWQYNSETGKYTYGLGGAISVSGKFVMYDGVIEGGKAEGVVTAWNADGTPKTYQRGIGGNIFAASGAVVEIYGGTIKNGTATHSGGNIYMDGTSTLLIEGGVIYGGRVTGKGRNGGNVFITGKATMTMNGGSILKGTSYNCAGNLYINGTVTMNGGVIADGVIRDWKTKEVNAASNSANVFSVQGDFYMYGGRITGSFQAIDTEKGKNPTLVYLSGYATIQGPEDQQCNDLFLSTGNDGITVRVGTLLDGAKVGVNASTGIFSMPTKEANLDNFYSNVDQAEVCYVDGCLALGRWSCVCGNNDKGNHYGECDGTQLFWAPLSSTTMPTATGNYYLIKDITAKAQLSVEENGDIKLDLNGYTLTGNKNYRALTTFNKGSSLTITDSSEGKTGVVKSVGSGATQGNVVWVRYGSFTLYGGTLDGSGYQLHKNWEAGTDGVFGTDDDKEADRIGGTVSMQGSTTFNMYGGTIIGNRMEGKELSKTVKTTEIVDGEEVITTTEVKRTVGTNGGGSLYIPGKAVFNMYAGEIRDGYSADRGGNIYIASSGIANLYGGVIKDGETAGWAGNIAIADTAQLNIMGATISGGVAAKNGGSIWTSGGGTLLKMTAGLVENGKTTGDQGGNIFCSGKMELLGGTITGGRVEKSGKNGGNIAINSAKDILIAGVTITDGYSAGSGGNIAISTTNTAGSLTIGAGTVISGGQAATHGGNLFASPNNYNKNNPVVIMSMTGGTIENGTAGSDGGNIYIGKSGEGESSLTITGGTITGGTAKTGGNIRVAGAAVTVNGDGVVIEKGVTNNSGHGANVNTSGTFTLKAGTVRDGKAANTAGNIYANGSGKIVIEGGKVLGGSDKNGANASTSSIYVVSGTLELRGGELDGGVNIINYNNNNGVLKMSGNPVIKSDTRAGLTITWSNGSGGTASHIPYIEIDEPMTEGAEVYISCTKWEVGKFTTATEESYTQYFHADDETRTVGYADSCIALGKTYCVCGSTTEEHKPGCNGEQLFWQPWSSGSALPTQPGNWYLYQNVKTGGQYAMAPDSTVRIDLNGKTVTDTSSRTISTAKANSSGNVELWITDTSAEQTGTMLLDYETYNGQGAIARICDGSDLILIAGTLDASKVGNTHGNGGVAVCVEGGSTFKMYGGTIIGAKSATTGGSVSVVGTGVMDMYGGTITGGNASEGGNIHIGADATVNIHGGTISDGKAEGTGGNIRNQGGTLNIYGGTITGGTAGCATRKGWGGNIEVNTKGSLTITGGTISGGTSGGNGGNIRMGADNGGAGDLVMTGGTITGGTSTKDQGGNLFAQGNVTITGGLIENGTAVNGGNIATNSSGTITLKNVTIQNGTASSAAGNIRISNQTAVVLNIGEGTLITGGTANAANANNANVQMNIAGTVNITGGQIDGYFRGISGGTINISGDPVITGGTTNLTRNGATINVKDLGENAKIGITDPNGGVFTTETEEKYVANFISDDPALSVGYEPNAKALALGKLYAECGLTEAHDAHDYCDGQLHLWLAWDVSSNTVPETTGHWYLPDDLTVTSGQGIGENESGKQVHLDLNGHDITVQFTGNGVAGRLYSTNGLKGGTFKLLLTNTGAADSSSIIIDDSKQQNNRGGDEGRVIWMTSGNVKTYVNNINIDLSGAKTDLDNGERVTKEGIAFTVGNGRHLYLYDVNITGGTEAVGSAILIHDGGSATLHNTTITGHTGSADGGGILVKSNEDGKVANLTLSGTTVISGNTKADGTAANITLQYVPNFTLTESYVGSTENPQGIDAPVDTVILQSVTEGWFVADDTAKKIVYMEDGMKLVAADATIYCVCGSTTHEHAAGCDGIDYEWTALNSLDDLKVGGNYYLTNNITTTTQIAFAGDAVTRLDLNGYTITDTTKRLFTTNGANNAEVTITDTYSGEKTTERPGGALIVTNAGKVYDGQGAGIWMAGKNNVVNWVAGTLNASGLTTNKYGGTALFIQNTNTFNLYSGTIKGGVATRVDGVTYTADSEPKGGTIRVNSGGTFNMYGGTVTGGKTVGTHGGNINLMGTMNMYGGVVENGSTAIYGTTNAHGGNIALNSADAVLNIYGGTIQNGTVHKGAWAGNLYMYPGTVNMSGGLITGGKVNTSTATMVANVCMRGGAVINMTGGQIDGRVSSGGNGEKILNFSGSAKIITPTADNPVANNNVSLSITVNIGKLNEDAQIGFQCSGVGGVDSEDALGGNKFLANLEYPDEFDLSKTGISVYIDKDNYNRTYELFIEDGKLYARQISATPKN